MSSCIGRYSFLSFVALATIHLYLSHNAAFAQVYFTGPYGPGGTWNLYEHRGARGWERAPSVGEPKSWTEAHQEAIARVENLSGTNARGHLIALSGPTAQQENDFVFDWLGPHGAWIGLTDNEAFGGGEAGTDGMAGFGNPAGDGVGWKWTNGEVFDYANWYPGYVRDDQDVASLGVLSKWFTGGGGSYIVEYETRSPTPLTLPPAPRPPLLPGLPPRAGAFGIREVAGNGQVIFLNDAVRSLQNIGPGALVRDYHASLIDFQTEFGFRYSTTGPNSPFELLRRGDIAFHQLDHFAMVAHGQILIPEGQGGEWTFGVNSDDGFELYIPGAPFDHSNNIVTHYGSFVFQGGRVAGTYPDVAHVTLQPGIHDIELVYFERDGYSSVELSAAPGRRPQHYTSFALVGAPAQNVVGRTPTVTAGYQFTNVQRIPNMPGDPPPAEQITSIAQAKQLLNSPDTNDRVGHSQATIVNHDSITTFEAGLPHGRYILDQEFQFPGNDFASMATSTLSVATAGTYTFGFAVLDGGELTIDGAQFREAFGEGLITNGGESLTLDRVSEDGIAFASVDLAAGTYPLEFLTYNRDREALAELFVAPGRVDFFDTGAFALLSGTATNIRHIRPAGLQLVPEPTTMLNAGMGALIVGLVAWRRHFRRERTPKNVAGTARSK